MEEVEYGTLSVDEGNGLFISGKMSRKNGGFRADLA